MLGVWLQVNKHQRALHLSRISQNPEVAFRRDYSPLPNEMISNFKYCITLISFYIFSTEFAPNYHNRAFEIDAEVWLNKCTVKISISLQ